MQEAIFNIKHTWKHSAKICLKKVGGRLWTRLASQSFIQLVSWLVS
jgi:hypothetical protein